MIRKIALPLGKALFSLKRQRSIRNPRKILVVRMGAIGDVLMTTPALKVIRSRFPESRIDYLVGNWSKSVLKDNPYIDSIIAFDDRIIFDKKISKILALVKRIRKKRYDLCIIFERDFRFNLLSFLFRIHIRVGFDRFGEGFSNNYNVPYKADKYELDYNLEISRILGVKVNDRNMSIFFSEDDKRFAENILVKNKVKGKLIGIAPGGGQNLGDVAAIKRWPLDKFIELTTDLTETNKVILFGGPSDVEAANKIVSVVKSENLIDTTGKTTIHQTAALMAKCNLVVTNDSGPMHIAGSVCKDMVVLFGPTPYWRFAPKNASVVRVKGKGCPCYDAWGRYGKCNKDCMGSISAKEVIDAVRVKIDN